MRNFHSLYISESRGNEELNQYKSANVLLWLCHFKKPTKPKLILVIPAMSKSSSLIRKMGLLRSKERRSKNRPDNTLVVWWKWLSRQRLDRRLLDFLDEMFFRLIFGVRYAVEAVVLVAEFCWFFVRFGFQVWQMQASHELCISLRNCS